ncbi:MAG TPA: hypothetical protein PKO18_00115 [Chitinophagales bacterium]|nr:hypothetical protein [Chitinophagales bacterium]HNL83604.1 hypothetical protein [Chitinophagales bacterium]
MKFLLYISVFILLSGFIKQSVYVDPTGTYILNNKTEYANSTKIGKIQVKKFSDKKIILNFYINMGSPAFNSGSFLDTLSYEKNKAEYKCPLEDTSCKVTLYFYKTGIKVIQETENKNSGCGFGHGVIASGFYKRFSTKIPIFEDPLKEK